MSDDQKRVDQIRERLAATTPGQWRSMNEGNQYLGTHYLPTAKLVGASRVDGLPRPWNPHAMVAFMKLDPAEVSRFVDADADFIAMSREDMAFLLSLATCTGCDKIRGTCNCERDE